MEYIPWHRDYLFRQEQNPGFETLRGQFFIRTVQATTAEAIAGHVHEESIKCNLEANSKNRPTIALLISQSKWRILEKNSRASGADQSSTFKRKNQKHDQRDMVGCDSCRG